LAFFICRGGFETRPYRRYHSRAERGRPILSYAIASPAANKLIAGFLGAAGGKTLIKTFGVLDRPDQLIF